MQVLVAHGSHWAELLKVMQASHSESPTSSLKSGRSQSWLLNTPSSQLLEAGAARKAQIAQVSCLEIAVNRPDRCCWRGTGPQQSTMSQVTRALVSTGGYALCSHQMSSVLCCRMIFQNCSGWVLVLHVGFGCTESRPPSRSRKCNSCLS